MKPLARETSAPPPRLQRFLRCLFDEIREGKGGQLNIIVLRIRLCWIKYAHKSQDYRAYSSITTDCKTAIDWLVFLIDPGQVFALASNPVGSVFLC